MKQKLTSTQMAVLREVEKGREGYSWVKNPSTARALIDRGYVIHTVSGMILTNKARTFLNAQP